MLVFGDSERRERPSEVLARVRARLRDAERCGPDLARHTALIAALIEAGELAQGLADADFHAAGEREGSSPGAAAAMALTMKVAGACAASWSGAFAEVGDGCDRELELCAARLPAGVVSFKQPEGYAHYLLYPETYLEAARQCPRARWQVIGVRSIGTSLGCMVAVGLGAPVPITVRPVGDPFDRQIRAGREAIDTEAGHYAVVDEGPGLSGSSIAAVIEWLVGAGVDEGRVHVFASHPGDPGRQARPRARQVWQRARADGRVHTVGFDAAILASPDPARRLATWVADLVGPLRGPLRDLSGGAWRALQHRPPADHCPPVHPWQERRKFLAASADGRWLVKFAGLGGLGERKLARARALADAGFTPEPLGLCHGFLVERWRDDALPLPARLAGPLRQEFIAALGRYLALRAVAFAAHSGPGASIDALHAMARANTEEALGPEAATAWDAWPPHLAALESQVSRVETDNRLHAWEWLVAGGTFLKTDAVDHASAHDLVGCQDIAWDLAGASVEFALSADEAGPLSEEVFRRSGRTVPAALLRFLTPCYVAFQLGSYVEAAAASDADVEAERLLAASRRYRDLLDLTLASPSFVPGAIC